jgi:hypothetical protein
MSTAANKAIVNPTEYIEQIGIVSPQIQSLLELELKYSRTGRIFGHKSSIEFLEILQDLAMLCEEKAQANDKEQERVRSIFEVAIEKRRPRQITHLNNILQSVATEIANFKPSTVTANETDPYLRSEIKFKFQLPTLMTKVAVFLTNRLWIC